MEDWVGLTPEKRERIYRLISVGEMGQKDFDKVISRVAAPDAEAAFLEISKSKFKKRILAYMTGVGLNNFESVTVDSVKYFLVKFPTPASFDSAKVDFWRR